MQITHIRANGITLAVEDAGPRDAPALVLIRGQGSQMAHWPRELIAGFVAAGFRTLAFDNRDVGLSQRCPVAEAPADADSILARVRAGHPLPAAYGLDDMARDVTDLMDALNIEKAHVFGISLGGMVTQQVMIDAPERLLSATIVMSSCRPANERFAGSDLSMVDLIESLLVRDLTRDEYVAAQIEEHANWGSPGYPMDPAEIAAMANLAFDRGVDAEGKNRQILAAANAPDRRPKLAQTKVPALVIHGEEDRLLPLDMGQEIADVILGSRFHAVAGMGHIITPALAPIIVEMVRDFIRPNG